MWCTLNGVHQEQQILTAACNSSNTAYSKHGVTQCGSNRLMLCSATHYRHAHYCDSNHNTPPPPVTTVGGGVTYIRWERTSRPTVNGTEDVYNGITAGSHYTHTGGGRNFICMVKEPRGTTLDLEVVALESTAQSTRLVGMLSIHYMTTTFCVQPAM